jgi:hypothetical protein
LIASIPAALEDDPVFARIALELAGAGPGEFYACGAYLLALAAGVEPGNMMVACRNPADDVADRLADAVGLFPVRLDKHPGVFSLTRPGERAITLAPMDGPDIGAHLDCASFSVMALAVDIGSSAPRGVIDPHGGIADLAAGTLRAVSPCSLSDDPARVLLAAELRHTYRLEPDAQTMACLQECCARMHSIEHQRAWDAVLRLYSGTGLSDTSRFLRDTGALEALFPELAAIYEVPQNYFHHLGVWEHTMEVLDRLEEILEDPSRHFKAYSNRLADYLGRPFAGGVPRRTLLAFAGLIHDIGKPPAMNVTSSGRIRFQTHDVEGCRLTLDMCSRLGLSRSVSDHLAGIVRDHMAVGNLIHEGETTASRLRCAMSLGDHCPEVVMLFIADRMATRGPATKEEKPDLSRRVATRVLNDWVWLHDYPPLIDGRDVMVHTGTGPGPDVGDALFKARVAQRESTVSNRTEALEYLAPDFKGKMDTRGD